MPLKIAINGYGRIGRNVLRALYEGKRRSELRIVALNDLGDVNTNAHLTRYDSAHGPFPFDVQVGDDELIVDGDRIKVCAEREPAKLPWKELGVDIVLESTGFFASKEKSSAHLAAGAGKVVISAPAGTGVDATIVYGVNHHILKSVDEIISNASCTTNCLAPLAKVLNDTVGIEHGLMTTIHAYTNDQVLTDVYHSDLRRARSATQSMIPTKTCAAASVGLVRPELDGRLDGSPSQGPESPANCRGREEGDHRPQAPLRPVESGENRPREGPERTGRQPRDRSIPVLGQGRLGPGASDDRQGVR